MATEFIEKKRWVFLGLPLTFTKYIIRENVLTIDAGFLKKTENDCYMYKIQDVELVSSLMERIFGLSTVICYTGDTTHPKLVLEHIKNGRAVKDFILEVSESARLKRRTINTVDIGTGNLDLDGDGFPD